LTIGMRFDLRRVLASNCVVAPRRLEKGLARLHDTLFFLDYERSERDPRESRALLQGGADICLNPVRQA
jgi:hypothetical protein